MDLPDSSKVNQNIVERELFIENDRGIEKSRTALEKDGSGFFFAAALSEEIKVLHRF